MLLKLGDDLEMIMNIAWVFVTIMAVFNVEMIVQFHNVTDEAASKAELKEDKKVVRWLTIGTITNFIIIGVGILAIARLFG